MTSALVESLHYSCCPLCTVFETVGVVRGKRIEIVVREGTEMSSALEKKVGSRQSRDNMRPPSSAAGPVLPRPFASSACTVAKHVLCQGTMTTATGVRELEAASSTLELLRGLKDLKNAVIGNTWKKVEVAEDEQLLDL